VYVAERERGGEWGLRLQEKSEESNISELVNQNGASEKEGHLVGVDRDIERHDSLLESLQGHQGERVLHQEMIAPKVHLHAPLKNLQA